MASKYRVTTDGGTFEVTTDEGDKPEQSGVMIRALGNFPRSAMNFAKSAAEMHGGGMDTYQPGQNVKPTDPIEDIKGAAKSIWNTVRHPGESFAEDPVGTAAVPLAMAHGMFPEATPMAGAVAKGAAKGTASQVRPLLTHASVIHPLRVLPQAYDLAKAAYQGGKEGLAEYKNRPMGWREDIPGTDTTSGEPVKPMGGGEFATPARGTAENPVARVMPLPKVQPLGPNEELGIHGGVENTPIPKANGRVEPFAADVHKSPATIARQLKGTGTTAEGNETPPEASKTMKARLEETGAMPIARQLKKSLEKGK